MFFFQGGHYIKINKTKHKGFASCHVSIDIDPYVVSSSPCSYQLWIPIITFTENRSLSVEGESYTWL